MRLAKRTAAALFLILKETYRFFLEKAVLRLFVHPHVAVSSAFHTVSARQSEKVIATAMCSAMGAEAPTPERVISGYCQGLLLLGRDRTDEFDWVLYPERAIITPEIARIPSRVQGYMRREEYEILENYDFEGVIRACRRRKWSWITDPLVEVYLDMNRRGFGQTFEAYKGGELVGGNWGFVVGNTYAMMSMFHRADRAGVVTFGSLVQALMDGRFGVLDCGLQQPHFERFGAKVVCRREFVEHVIRGLCTPP